MKTRRGTICCNGARSARNKKGARKGEQKKNGTLISNGTRRKRNKPSSSVRVDRRLKVLPNRVRVKFNVANECTEEELFVLRKIVYMQQYDIYKCTHDPLKPVAWFTVAALINVNEWTWDALKCMNVWEIDQAASGVRKCPFSASEDEFLLQYGSTGTDTFWCNLANVFKRDPGVVHDRWLELMTSAISEGAGFCSKIQSFSLHEPYWQNDEADADVIDGGSAEDVAATPRAVSLPPAPLLVTALDNHTSSRISDLPPAPAQPEITYKPIRKTEKPLETLNETEGDGKAGEATDDWSSEDVSGGDDTWEGSACSARSVIFPFTWESVDTPTSEVH